MNSNHCQLFTILIGFRTASPESFIKRENRFFNVRLKQYLVQFTYNIIYYHTIELFVSLFYWSYKLFP